MNELVHLVVEQVGAGAFHQLHVGQLVLQGQLLHPKLLFQPHRLQGAGVDTGIVGGDHHPHAGHIADTGHHAAAGHALVRVRVIQAIAGQGGQLQERRTGVQYQGNALPGEQLPPSLEALLGGFRLGPGAVLQFADTRQQGVHTLLILTKGIAAGG